MTAIKIALFRLCGSHVEIRVILLIVQITDVRNDKGVELTTAIMRMKAKCRSICAFVVANGLVRRTLVLFSLDLLLENRNGLVLGREISSKLLEHRLIKGRESVEKCLRVEVIVGTILIRLVIDVGASGTTASAGRPSARSIIRSIG